MLDKIVGAVFPLPHGAIERLLSKESDIFAKFGRFLHLSKDHKILFYDSDIHAIVGEATIEKVVFMKPLAVWAKYGPRLFVNKDEFDEYVSKSPLGPRDLKNKVMTICLLRDPKKYSHAKRPARKMNMIGHYLRG